MNPLDVASGEAVTLAGPAAAQGAALLKLLVALGAVLLAFWVFARLMRGFDGRGSRVAGDLSVLGSVALGQRERLVVVRAGTERLVLGVTAHSISRVHVLGADASVGAGLDAAAPDPCGGDEGSPHGIGADFGARLRAALGHPVR